MINDFLLQNMMANELPKKIIDKLIDDHKMTHQKFDNLFFVLTKDKWDKAIAKVFRCERIDFADVSTFTKEAAKI